MLENHLLLGTIVQVLLFHIFWEDRLKECLLVLYSFRNPEIQRLLFFYGLWLPENEFNQHR